MQTWLLKNKLTLKAANGEQIIQKNIKFDRIICNMVLMLTSNAQKMLKSLYEQAEQGCLLGIAIVGKKQMNQYQYLVQQIINKIQIQKPKIRQNSYLYNKVQQLGSQVGWKTIAAWEQVALFPYLFSNLLEMFGKGHIYQKTFLNEEQKKWAFQQYMKRQQQKMNQSKQAFTFHANF